MSESGPADKDDGVTRLQSALDDCMQNLRRPTDGRVYFDVDAAHITDTAKILATEMNARLQTASAVDAPQKIEILYHWALDSIGLVVTVRTRVDRQQPRIESITGICPSAEWIEREIWELMGVTFAGHPDMRHLLLDDDWPDGKFPLRRDYTRD